MKHIKLLIILVGILFVKVVFGQSASPSPSPVAVASSLDAISAWINLHLMASAGIIAVIIEAVAHAIPSANPQGWLHWLSAVLKSVSNLSSTGAQFLDKVVPQNNSQP